MPSGRPGPRGGLDPTVDSDHFPSTWSSLHAKTRIEWKIFHKTATGIEYTDPVDVSACDGFSIYARGTGVCQVQVACNSGAFWVDHPDTGATLTDGGVYANTERHHWMRMEVANAATLEIWVYRRYPAY